MQENSSVEWSILKMSRSHFPVTDFGFYFNPYKNYCRLNSGKVGSLAVDDWKFTNKHVI